MAAAGENVLDFVLKKIEDAPFLPVEFPCFYVSEVFPSDYYRNLLSKLPEEGAYKEHLPPYQKRYVFDLANANNISNLDASWKEVIQGLYSQKFLNGMARKFSQFIPDVYKGRGDFLRPHIESGSVKIGNRAVLTKDYECYALGPHTDAPPKFITALFYLAEDNSMADYGTSIYAPEKPLLDWNGRHFPFEGFKLVTTAPYNPNSAFFFLKNDKSFHGVEHRDHPGKVRNNLMWTSEIGETERSLGFNQLPLELFKRKRFFFF
jgi:hypothetical protein